MASCSLASLQAQACANGFFGLSAKDAIELQFWHYLSKNTLTLAQLKAQACANGFSSVDQKDFRAIELQLLCNIYGGSSPVPGPVNLIPAGAHYNDWAYDVSNLLQPGGTYKLTWGTNELDFSYGNSVTIGNPGAGQTSTFTYPQIGGPADLDEIGAVSAGLPVTATICSV